MAMRRLMDMILKNWWSRDARKRVDGAPLTGAEARSATTTQIHSFRISTRALSAKEIAALYKEDN